MSDKALFSSIFYISDQYKTQKISDRITSDDPFSLRYVLNQYKAQQICNKAVHDCIAALKFIPDWFVTNKMINKIFTALYAGENILYFNKDSGNVPFVMEWVFLI